MFQERIARRSRRKRVTVEPPPPRSSDPARRTESQISGTFSLKGQWGRAFPLNMRMVTGTWSASITATSRMVSDEHSQLLRQNTTMTIGWIADRLQMGTPGHLSHLLYWEGKTKPKQEGRK